MKITLVDSRERALAPWLIGYLGAWTDSGEQTVRRVIPARPNSFVQIILDGSHTMVDVESGERLAVPRFALFGPLTHYRYDMEITGTLRTFSARLQPAAAGALFGIDPAALVDSFVPVCLPEMVLSQLQGASGWAEMVPFADHCLCELAAGKPGPDQVAQAARKLRELHGQAGIHDLASEAGVSLRHFQRRFKAQTGLNPKLYARVCRISHAVHRKQIEPALSWTEVAFEAGYADQSHFIRDFKALTGVLPRNFLRGQHQIVRNPRWGE